MLSARVTIEPPPSIFSRQLTDRFIDFRVVECGLRQWLKNVSRHFAFLSSGQEKQKSCRQTKTKFRKAKKLSRLSNNDSKTNERKDGEKCSLSDIENSLLDSRSLSGSMLSLINERCQVKIREQFQNFSNVKKTYRNINIFISSSSSTSNTESLKLCSLIEKFYAFNLSVRVCLSVWPVAD